MGEGRTGLALERLPTVCESVVVASQRIENLSGTAVGNELLFRPSGTADGSGLGDAGFDDDVATATVLSAVATAFDREELAPGGLLFVNLPRSFVVGDLPVPLRPEGVVLELLERVPLDPEVVAGARRLVVQGFAIALDDVVPGDPRLVLAPLCAYVKIDLSTVVGQELDRLVAQVRSDAPDARLVAEHVEVEADRERARQVGFDLLQGYLVSRPRVLAHGALAHHNWTAVHLLHQLAVPASSTRSLARLATGDPAITARLLRAVNNVAGVRLPVTDLARAITLVGRDRFHSILVLSLVAQLGHDDDELCVSAVARATAAGLLCPQDPLAAATTAVLRLVARLLAMTPNEVDEWLAVPPPAAAVALACDALDRHLDAADRGVEAALPEPFRPLTVSLAWLAGVREGRALVAQVSGGRWRSR